MSDSISRVGIVDKVEAVRQKKEVVRLDVTIRVETMLASIHYGEDLHTDHYKVAMPPDSPVNPGDIVAVSFEFQSPFRQRFVPALDVSNGDDEEEE